MSDAQRLATERIVLRSKIEALVGPGPIERFEEALTHASFANEVGVPNNQRLEFLGDSVLGLCVSEMLAGAHADADEGMLTRMRAALVNADALAAWARRVGLGPCIALGRGAKLGSEREQTNVLADTAEALLAAVYEARGIEGARVIVRDVVGELLEKAPSLGVRDPKSALQEDVQSRRLPAPTYRIVEVKGVAHEQVFVVEVMVGDLVVATGEGRSKRLAERAAAVAALDTIDSVPSKLPDGAGPESETSESPDSPDAAEASGATGERF
jgi:ribonuclease-3